MSNKSEHFSALEGLRAWLAIWVAIGHGLQTSGYLTLSGIGSLLLAGDAAVHVFIILSGFVISHLLISRRERYIPYITRRFFRLFPAYFFACALGYGAMHLWPEVVTNVSWAEAPGWAAYKESVLEIAGQSLNNTIAHGLLHLTMLHGIVPTEILPRAAMTFLPAAWSVSLEWQFYLLAPIIVYACLSGKATRLAVASITLILFSAYHLGVFGQFPIGSFILNGAPYFALGIISRLWIFEGGQNKHLLCIPFLISLAIAEFMGHRYLGPIVWFGFFFFFCLPAKNRIRSLALTAVDNNITNKIGRASYSLYLLHRPIQVAFAWFAINFGISSQPALLATQIAAVFVTIILSLVTWKYIEIPWQIRGKGIADRF